MRALVKKYPSTSLFLLAIAICLAFAIFTLHRWEDYYITFRVSRNLVEGHGLVFQPGERVHTFTSPIGVLLPALALQLAGGHSDSAALWIYRAMCICSLGSAAVLLWRSARAFGWSPFASVLLPVLLLTDAKSVDYTVNGMETAFMLLLLAAILHTLSAGGPDTWWKLGLCWGGLMWTRPDGFVFGGAIALAWLLVLPAHSASPDRRSLLCVYLRAALLAGAIYAPWLAWAWSYYGSPVPNTIVAKGLASHVPTFADLPGLLLRQTVLFPWSGGVRDMFLPAYVWFGGWPAWLKIYAIGVAWGCMFVWLWPKARPLTRTFSLTLFLCMLYGAAAPAAPWYVPSHALFALLTIAAVADEILRARPDSQLARAPFVLHALFCATLLGAVAWQMRLQQSIIEGQRADLGRWLRAQSHTPRDSVWLEPLGYIGYFSQLKMLDFPGLCAPEVIAARRMLGDEWPKLIRRLQPDWIILRRNYSQWLQGAEPALTHGEYRLVQTFDAARQVAAVRFLPGRAYLEQDQTFDIYRRVTGKQ